MKRNVYILIVSVCLSSLSLCAQEEQKELFHENASGDFIWFSQFVRCCKHIYDTRNRRKYPIKPKKVLPGDIVYVRNAKKFFSKVAPYIENPYIIVTHGWTGNAFKDAYKKYLDKPNIIAWFTIHPTNLKHPKLFYLPLGVVHGKKNKIIRNLGKKFLKLRKRHKKHLLYLNIFKNTSTRAQILQDYADKPYCYYAEKRKSVDRYFDDLSQSKFTLAPPGIGIDSFRTWESLLVGSIPIVISSQLNDLYEGLPVLIVDNYDDLTQEFLEEKYEEITSQTYPLDKLHMNYWRAQIKQVQRDFLENYDQG